MHKNEALDRELKELQTQSFNRQHDLEKRLRASQEENRSLQEDVTEAQTELSTVDRQRKFQLQDVETKHEALKRTLNDLRNDLDQKTFTLQTTEEKLIQREAEVGQLETELVDLKAKVGDVGELDTIRRDLSEQVEHIRRLEKANREQMTELRHLRQIHKSVEIVEEEKRVLENRVKGMDDLRRELGESEIQRKRIEDERESWASFLREAGSNGEPDFDSPEGLARALAEERVEKASLMEQLGAVRPEISEKEAIISSLEAERDKLHAELEKSKTSSGGSDTRAKTRLERQKALAVKEVEYLREQLRTFDSEDITGEIHTDAEEQSCKRIQDLETLLEQYRSELQSLHDDLSKQDISPAEPTAQSLKRPREEDPDERLGQLSRKNRKLQGELTALQQGYTLAQSELAATKSQLSSLQDSLRTRVLSLRSNPTDDFQNYKFSTIASLREENAGLLSQLQGAPHSAKVVHISTLQNAKNEGAEIAKTIKEKEKFILRLKQIFSVKSLEYREAVVLLLGWKMEIMANGHFRMTSVYNPGNGDGEGGGGNYLIFDGDKGNMKIGGGPESDFAREIRGLIRFWVEERNEVPLFLAAATLEFYEKTTRARKVGVV